MADEQWVYYYGRWTVSILIRQMNSEYTIMVDEQWVSITADE